MWENYNFIFLLVFLTFGFRIVSTASTVAYTVSH